MSSFPRAEQIIDAYEDQLEALERLFHARAALAAHPKSRFFGLRDGEIEDRLRRDREELELWAVMMLTASFEASIRTDARDRIEARTRDSIRAPLRDLYKKHGDRVRLDDLLDLWDVHAAVGSAVKQGVRRLFKHRHWLAHGRYWTNKHGAIPSPLDARAHLDDYVQAIQPHAPDFPRG